MSNDEEKKIERVPKNPPYGSITDGSMICARCLLDKTGCALCAGEVRRLIHSGQNY